MNIQVEYYCQKSKVLGGINGNYSMLVFNVQHSEIRGCNGFSRCCTDGLEAIYVVVNKDLLYRCYPSSDVLDVSHE